MYYIFVLQNKYIYSVVIDLQIDGTLVDKINNAEIYLKKLKRRKYDFEAKFTELHSKIKEQHALIIDQQVFKNKRISG